MMLKKNPRKIDGWNEPNTGIWFADPIGTLSVYGFGSGGFVSAPSRMDPDQVPLPKRRLEPETARRLAAAMNNVDGLATSDITKDLVEHVEQALREIANGLPDTLGGGTASALNSVDVREYMGGNDRAEIHAFNARPHVDGKAAPFVWGLCTDPANPVASSLSEQTYTRADAERLVAAWNATLRMPLPALEMRWLQDAMALIVFTASQGHDVIHAAVQEAYADNDFRDILARHTAEAVLVTGARIQSSRRASGFCADTGATIEVAEDAETETSSPGLR